VGCEVLCNYAEALVAQSEDSSHHIPVITFQKGDASHAVTPYGLSDSANVSQMIVDGGAWVLGAAAEIGEDWQIHAVLDVATPSSDHRQ
jgi:hypothetical protein